MDIKEFIVIWTFAGLMLALAIGALKLGFIVRPWPDRYEETYTRPAGLARYDHEKPALSSTKIDWRPATQYQHNVRPVEVRLARYDRYKQMRLAFANQWVMATCLDPGQTVVSEFYSIKDDDHGWVLQYAQIANERSWRCTYRRTTNLGGLNLARASVLCEKRAL